MPHRSRGFIRICPPSVFLRRGTAERAPRSTVSRAWEIGRARQTRLAPSCHLSRICFTSAHVECGGLPPLSAVPACRDVLHAFARANESGDASSTASSPGVEVIAHSCCSVTSAGEASLACNTAAASRRTPQFSARDRAPGPRHPNAALGMACHVPTKPVQAAQPNEFFSHSSVKDTRLRSPRRTSPRQATH